MRPTLLIIGSIVLVAVGFVAYILLQTSPPKGGTIYQPIAAPPPPNTNEVDTQQLHPGESAYIKSYDSKTHQLANEFRAETYDPKQDGTIDMTKPDAIFYLGGGQTLRIVGETGNVVDPNSAGGKIQGQSQMPSRGKMQHCILKLFKSVDDMKGDKPQFTCWVNNLAFDNDTTIIATEECQLPDSHGNVVDTPADQVPVHVVGVDYDFDGRGLTIKWNERDRHLERLEIAHGEQLIIKHPNSLSSDEKPATEPATQPSEPVSFGRPMGPDRADTARLCAAEQPPLSDANGPIALVSTSPEDATSAIAASGAPPATSPATTRPAKRRKHKPTSKPVPPPTSAPVIRRNKDAGVYRATFFDNVHVTQADQTLATADRMNVDFFMGNGHATTEPSTQEFAPTSASANQPIANETATAVPQEESTPPAAKQPKHAAAAHRPAAPASTQPDVPVIVRWTGKLVVAPPDSDVPPLAVGDSVLQMIGDAVPAVLDRAGSVIHCASFLYHTLDKSVEINNSDALPIVTLLDANGTRVFAPSIAYNGSDNTATIPGPARAEFPVASNSASSTQPTTRAVQIAKADWSDSCTLVMQPGAKGDMQVTEALLDGDVHVDHPQVKLNADELDLGLDNTPRPSAAKSPTTQGTTATTTSGQLREMNASGSVDCTLHDSQGKPQRIIADHLTLNTKRDATGTDVPSELTADGTVHTFDQTQSLHCQHLIAELEPAARASTGSAADRPYGGDVQLRELTATQDVHFTAADGSFADSDNLHVETIKPATATTPADQEIQLMGQPTARVGDRQNVVTGPIIHYNPGTKEANVIGPGTIHGVQSALADPAHPGPTSRPIDVAWQKSFAMHGNDNRIDIVGDVHTKSFAADGTVDTALSDRVHMTLIDAPPTTAPSTAPSAAPATVPASAPGVLVKGSDSNFMKDKLIDTVTLLAKGNENIQVSSIARDPSGAILHAMNLFATTATYDKTHDKFIVPVPGRMLVRDYRSTTPTTVPSDSSAGGMHGTSAFQWTKSLVYDQREDKAVMTGDVQVVHEAPGTAPYQMWANTITAYMDPNSHPTTRPTTGPTTGPTPVSTTQPIPTGEDAMKVKRMVADGQVRMISQRLQFLAAQAIYDPQTQVMTAHGSQREPGEMLDEQGLSTASFDALRYNTVTGQVQLEGFNGNMRK